MVEKSETRHQPTEGPGSLQDGSQPSADTSLLADTLPGCKLASQMTSRYILPRAFLRFLDQALRGWGGWGEAHSLRDPHPTTFLLYSCSEASPKGTGCPPPALILTLTPDLLDLLRDCTLRGLFGKEAQDWSVFGNRMSARIPRVQQARGLNLLGYLPKSPRANGHRK